MALFDLFDAERLPVILNSLLTTWFWKNAGWNICGCFGRGSVICFSCFLLWLPEMMKSLLFRLFYPWPITVGTRPAPAYANSTWTSCPWLLAATIACRLAVLLFELFCYRGLRKLSFRTALSWASWSRWWFLPWMKSLVTLSKSFAFLTVLTKLFPLLIFPFLGLFEADGSAPCAMCYTLKLVPSSAEQFSESSSCEYLAIEPKSWNSPCWNVC